MSLTDEQIVRMWADKFDGDGDKGIIGFARAVIAADRQVRQAPEGDRDEALRLAREAGLLNGSNAFTGVDGMESRLKRLIALARASAAPQQEPMPNERDDARALLKRALSILDGETGDDSSALVRCDIRSFLFRVQTFLSPIDPSDDSIEDALADAVSDGEGRLYARYVRQHLSKRRLIISTAPDALDARRIRAQELIRAAEWFEHRGDWQITDVQAAIELRRMAAALASEPHKER